MKKHIITLAIALGFGMNLSAQSDGFFTSNYNYGQNREATGQTWADDVNLPGHGLTLNQSAANDTPVGSGLLILGGLALAYGMRKKNS